VACGSLNVGMCSDAKAHSIYHLIVRNTEHRYNISSNRLCRRVCQPKDGEVIGADDDVGVAVLGVKLDAKGFRVQYLARPD
jgi:hypothetical protein